MTKLFLCVVDKNVILNEITKSSRCTTQATVSSSHFYLGKTQGSISRSHQHRDFARHMGETMVFVQVSCGRERERERAPAGWEKRWNLLFIVETNDVQSVALSLYIYIELKSKSCTIYRERIMMMVIQFLLHHKTPNQYELLWYSVCNTRMRHVIVVAVYPSVIAS